MIRVRPHLLHRKRDLLPLRFGDMRIQLRQTHHGHHTHDRAHQGNRKKRTVPTTHIGQKQATGHAHHGRHGKRCHHKTCCPPTPLKRNHVSNHRLRHGRQDATNSACRHTSCHQQAVTWGQGTGKRRQTKQHIEHQQQAFALKTIHKGCGQQTGRSCGKGVSRHQKTKLRIVDGKQITQLRTQWHDDHEVKHMGELDTGQGKQ